VLRGWRWGCGRDGAREPVERSRGRTDLAGRDAEMARRGRETAMAEEQLNGADVGAGFEQMYGERMSQRCGVMGFANRARRRALWHACPTASLVMGCPGRSPGKSQVVGRSPATRFAAAPTTWGRASRSDPSGPSLARRE
jgi:hypothetical protein